MMKLEGSLDRGADSKN